MMMMKKILCNYMDTIIDDLVNDLKKAYPEPNVQNIAEVLIHAMTLIAVYPNLTGIQKKQLVIDSLNRLVDETHYRDDVMDPILKSMIPSLIDNLVDVRTGQFRPRKNCICL